jgi:hypothetical protein
LRLLLISQAHARSARPLAPLPDVVFDHLPFPKFLECNPLNLGMMEEQIVPLALDKSKTPIRHQPLDLTLWHLWPPEKNL